MGLTSGEQTFVDKIVGIVDSWMQSRWQRNVPTEAVDTLYAEIYQLQQTLAQAPTRPVRRLNGHSRVLEEPITEQQRIMDMSG